MSDIESVDINNYVINDSIVVKYNLDFIYDDEITPLPYEDFPTTLEEEAIFFYKIYNIINDDYNYSLDKLEIIYKQLNVNPFNPFDIPDCNCKHNKNLGTFFYKYHNSDCPYDNKIKSLSKYDFKDNENLMDISKEGLKKLITYKMDNINIKKVNNCTKPFLLYKINKLKNKIKNNSLNKDISIKIKGKIYNFKSNKNIILEHKPKINNYSNNINNFKKIYYSKYNKITNEDIDMKKLEIEDKEKNNKLYWEEYDKSVLKTKNKFNNIFRNDPVIENKKELFNEKYKNKSLSNIYKSIISEIDILDKEYNNYKIVESYYNKLKENVEIKTIFKNNKSNIAKLFSDYENTRIAEYNFLKNIGELIISSKLNKEEIKEINSLNQNTRPYRIIKQSQRIYLLEEFVNIKNIALSGISNWLRDTSDDNFNILLSLFVT